ncbi:MAG: hypothetical protein ACYDAM_09000 [Leptospirales bacterium]
MADKDEKEPELIITDRRPRFDVDPEPGPVVPPPAASSAAPKAEETHHHHGHEGHDDGHPRQGESGLHRDHAGEPPGEARLDQILAILSGMVLNHLAFDPETRRPIPSFSLKEARFFLGLMEKFQEAFNQHLPLSVMASPDADEDPKLGHIPAILGGMAISSLGVDPRTGKPERPPDFESARYLIDLMDLFVKEGESSLDPEEREYVKDMVYQAKMYFVSLKDRTG